MLDDNSRYGKCSKCGGELTPKEPFAILTSYPAQIALYCVECGNVEYMRVETMPAEVEEKMRLYELFERVAELEKKVAKLLGEGASTTRDCKTCGYSNDGKCAYTEECHECMWVNNYIEAGEEK